LKAGPGKRKISPKKNGKGQGVPTPKGKKGVFEKKKRGGKKARKKKKKKGGIEKGSGKGKTGKLPLTAWEESVWLKKKFCKRRKKQKTKKRNREKRVECFRSLEGQGKKRDGFGEDRGGEESGQGTEKRKKKKRKGDRGGW